MKNNEFIFKLYETGILQDFDFIYFEFYQQKNSIKLIDEEYCFKGNFNDFVKHLKFFGFKFKDFNLMNFQIFNRKFELIAFNDIEDLRKLIEEGEDLAIKIEVINDLI